MSKKQAAKIRTIETKLWQAFDWASTPQGHNYWAGVEQNLHDLAIAEQEPKQRSKK